MLFSEPKIPQIRAAAAIAGAGAVSVLFSEPKIPQILNIRAPADRLAGFSALQRAENSSMLGVVLPAVFAYFTVSVLFSEPKIPQFPDVNQPIDPTNNVSVLFSEPKIPQ